MKMELQQHHKISIVGGYDGSAGVPLAWLVTG
jgi:hypothetical protein